MSRRVSLWGGLSISLLLLGSCLLPDVGIDPALDEPSTTVGAAQGGSSGSGGSSAAGSGGSAAVPAGAAGSSAMGGSEGNPPVTVPPQAGSAGMVASGNAGNAGSGSMPPSGGGAAGAGGSGGLIPGASDRCPDTTDKETACANYCALYTEVCQDFEALGQRPYDYEGSADCLNFCVTQTDWAVGTVSPGNTVMCRCGHSYLALSQGLNPHCFHAARLSTGICL